MHLRDCLQRIDGKRRAALAVAADEESRKTEVQLRLCWRQRRRGLGVLRRVAEDTVESAGLEEELRPILKIVVELHFGDHGVDAHLQRQDVDLAQHRLDRVDLAPRTVQQDGVVLVVRYDAQSIGFGFGGAGLERP